ncbi:MAG TPA: hypothetical protein VNT02_15990, partial [Burkholderiales bacterium]|nr:hypothetical protein [Burkholderiales bacterium]
MNTIAEPVRLSLEHLRDLLPAARAEAASTRRRVMEILQERSGLDADGFVWDLGAALRYPVLRLPVLNRLAPAFELLPYAEAVQRECVLLRRSDGGLLLAFANPFDETLRAWAEERIH